MSSMKEKTRFQIRMNSIREESNSKWKQFSNIYSKFLIRFSWSILAISSFISIGLTIYFLLFMEIRSFDQTDFLISNSRAMKNAFHIRQIFGNDTDFRIHQQLNLSPGLDIIIKRKFDTNQTNMLSYEIIDEIRLLDKQIQSIRINNSLEYNYSSLCLKINHACNIDGNYLLTDKFREDISYLLPPKSGYYFDSSGASAIPGFIFGKEYHFANLTQTNSDYEEQDDSKEIIEPTFEQIISYVSLFRLRYSLNTTTKEMQQFATQWEREVFHYLTDEYQSILINVFPSTSTAITDTITRKAQEDGLYIMLMILIFFIFYTLFLSIQGNRHTSLGYLPICGIISIGLSTSATFGLLSLFHIQIIEPMALLVFIVILIDCIRFSIVCGEYHRIIKDHNDISSEIDIEKILPSIIESTHPYFLTSTLIISIVYLLFSFITPMLSTKLICLTLILYICINYLLHLTYFSSCLVITLKRVSSRRHSLFCYRLPMDKNIKINEKVSKIKSFKKRMNLLLNQNSIWKKISSIILCLLFILFFLSSIWFTLSIDTSLYEDKFLPRDAYALRKYMESQMNDFDVGPVIMFVIPEPIDYKNEEIKSSINSLITQCQNQTRINRFQLLWLDHENIDYIINSKEDLQVRVTPFSRNDLIVSQGFNSSTIIASRFYCQYKSIKGDREDIQIMKNLYTYSNENLIPNIFPYSLLFSTYESLNQIRMEIYFLIILLIICCFIITLISFISFEKSLLILLHFLTLITSTLTCLYLFHHLTFNFANVLWLYIIPIIYLDTFIHRSFNKLNSNWEYNRVIISLIISLFIFSFFPIQSYVFQIIFLSLMYQSIICLLLINLIYPSWNYLLHLRNPPDEGVKSTTTIESNQALNSSI